MSNLLEELWYGNIAPIDNIGVTPEIKSKRKELAQKYEKLKEKLEKEQKQLLNEYDESSIELSSLYECKIFEYSFRLGFDFAKELLINKTKF